MKIVIRFFAFFLLVVVHGTALGDTVLYDDFSGENLDAAKWESYSDGESPVIINGALELAISGRDTKRTNTLMFPYDPDRTFMETKVTISSESYASSGARGKFRIGASLYNDILGPGSGKSHNGAEGEVWAEFRLALDDNNTLKASAEIERADDAEENNSTILFYQEFNAIIDFDTEYTMSMEFKNGVFTFILDEEAYSYTVETPTYVPRNGHQIFTSRLYLDDGEEGKFKASIDDVRVAYDAADNTVLEGYIINSREPLGAGYNIWAGFEVFNADASFKDGVESITITSPSGKVLPYDKDDFVLRDYGRYYSLDFSPVFPGPPELGTYTFTTVVNGITYTATDTQYINRELPNPDKTAFRIDGQTFSWNLVDYEEDIPLFYRFRIYEMNGNRLFSTGNTQDMASFTYDSGGLTPGKRYRMQMRVSDSYDWFQVQNNAVSRRYFTFGAEEPFAPVFEWFAMNHTIYEDGKDLYRINFSILDDQNHFVTQGIESLEMVDAATGNTIPVSLGNLDHHDAVQFDITHDKSTGAFSYASHQAHGFFGPVGSVLENGAYTLKSSVLDDQGRSHAISTQAMADSFLDAENLPIVSVNTFACSNDENGNFILKWETPQIDNETANTRAYICVYKNETMVAYIKSELDNDVGSFLVHDNIIKQIEALGANRYEIQVQIKTTDGTARTCSSILERSSLRNTDVPDLSDPDSYLQLTNGVPYTLSTGTCTQVYGGAGTNRIVVKTGSRANLLSFTGSNVIYMESDASVFKVSRSGANVTLTGSENTIIAIPATAQAQTIAFSNGASELVINNGVIMLGDQEIGLQPSPVDNPTLPVPDLNPAGPGSLSHPDAYLRLDCGKTYSLPSGSSTQVHGSSEANHLILESGAVAKLSSFAGASNITIQSDSDLFSASRSDATVTLEGTDGTILVIPATQNTQSIIFNNQTLELVIKNGAVLFGGNSI